MRTQRRHLPGILGALLLAVLCALLLLAFAAWLRLRPMAGEWTTRVPLWRGAGAPHVLLSVPRLLQAATNPRLARWFDGRVLDTRVGAVRLNWSAGTGTLGARCAPCRLQLQALGPQPLWLSSAEISLRREGEWHRTGQIGEWPLSGQITSGAVRMPWQGVLSRSGLQLHGELPATPIAAVYALFAAAMPELQQAHIEGQVSASWQLQWPEGTGTVTPVLQGFTVQGLNTERLLHVRLPARCAATAAAPPSRWLPSALIAAEDQRFFEHPGYDLAGLLASFQANQHAGTVRGGGSTLTQQLAKLLFTGDERSAARKMRELLYAVEMERTLGKARILQLYLALAPWGPGVCGAEAAARHHLGKPAAQLDVLEAAWLVSLLPRPMTTPAPVDAERVALIVRDMRGAGARQRRLWLRALPAWQPPVRGATLSG